MNCYQRVNKAINPYRTIPFSKRFELQLLPKLEKIVMRTFFFVLILENEWWKGNDETFFWSSKSSGVSQHIPGIGHQSFWPTGQQTLKASLSRLSPYWRMEWRIREVLQKIKPPQLKNQKLSLSQPRKGSTFKILPADKCTPKHTQKESMIFNISSPPQQSSSSIWSKNP